MCWWCASPCVCLCEQADGITGGRVRKCGNLPLLGHFQNSRNQFFLAVVREQQGRLLHEGREPESRGKADAISTLIDNGTVPPIQTRRSERTCDDNHNSWVSQECSDDPVGLQRWGRSEIKPASRVSDWGLGGHKAGHRHPPCSCSPQNSQRQGDALGSGTSLLCIVLAMQAPAMNEASLQRSGQQFTQAGTHRTYLWVPGWGSQLSGSWEYKQAFIALTWSLHACTLCLLPQELCVSPGPGHPAVVLAMLQVCQHLAPSYWVDFQDWP